MSASTELFEAAANLDEAPETLLVGGATRALLALEIGASERHSVAARHRVSGTVVDRLWDRAAAVLREPPSPADLFESAASAATLLYVAAWFLEAPQVTVDDLEQVL